MPRNTQNTKAPGVQEGCMNGTGCRVETIVSVDERGQILLPKDLRARVGIKPGDRLAVTSWERNGKICCITLTKVEGLTELVKNSLGPVLKEIL